MKGLKIAIIGAGSTYTPELIEGFIIRKEELNVESFYLMDINKEKLQIIGELSERMIKRSLLSSKIVLTTNLEEAIVDADYILTQVRIGGLEARVRDEKIPMKYDLLGQETTGAGGFMKALRTMPVLMEVAKLIEETAPEAWLINFTNPSGIIAEALLNNTKVKMLSLCNVPISMAKDAREMLPEEVHSFDYDYIGLNHLSWITSIYADGVDVLPNILDEKIELTTMKNIDQTNYDYELLKATKGIPSSYLNYFYFREEKINHNKSEEKTRGEICMDIEKELLEIYKDVNLAEKPALLEKRGGAYYSTVAVSLIDAIENDRNEMHVVNTKNNGALDFMDDNDVVEVKCIINKNGATPIKIKNDNPYIIGLMKGVKAYEKLTVSAGLRGDMDAALAALLVHPLIGDYNKAKPLLDEMLEANKEYLPQFYNKK